MRHRRNKVVEWMWRRVERLAVMAAIAWVWIWLHSPAAEKRAPRDAGAH